MIVLFVLWLQFKSGDSLIGEAILSSYGLPGLGFFYKMPIEELCHCVFGIQNFQERREEAAMILRDEESDIIVCFKC